MTSPPQPPGYPPYGQQPWEQQPYGQPYYGHGPQPPYGPPPRRAGSGAALTTLLAIVFLAATGVVAWAVNAQDPPSTSNSRVVGPGPQPGGGASASVPTSLSPSLPSYAPSSLPTYSPTPTPTHQPLNGQTVDRTMQVFMNALLNRSLSQVKSVTCPKLRRTTDGTALNHKYINRYQIRGYRIYDSLDYVIVPTKVRYENGKSHTYRWYVNRYSDGQYLVCGYA